MKSQRSSWQRMKKCQGVWCEGEWGVERSEKHAGRDEIAMTTGPALGGHRGRIAPSGSKRGELGWACHVVVSYT